MISPLSTPVRIAAVTGANKGIGFNIALQLATSGLFSKIILCCRDPTRGKNAVTTIQTQLELLKKTNTSISFLPLTVGDQSSHDALTDAITNEFGKLDVLVNNAGTAFKGSDPTPFQDQTKPTLDVNYRGTVNLTMQLLPLLRKGQDPRIVNVASMAGRLRQIPSAELRDKLSSDQLTLSELNDLVDQFERDVHNGNHVQQGWGNSNYGMSKLSLIAATKVMARDESGSGVKVNCCCPGYCDTDMTSHKGTRSATDGAKNAVLPATMEDCPTGVFFENCQVSNW